MKLTHCLIMSSLLLTACAQPLQRTDSTQPLEPQEQMAEASPHGPLPEVEPVLPNIDLSKELVYEFLLTEIANQRGYKSLAEEGSAAMTKKTRDPRIARRAAQLAFESGDLNKSINAFRQWQEIEPASPLAGRMLSSILLRSGKLDEARLELSKLLKMAEANPGNTFMQIFQLLAAYAEQPAVVELIRGLAQPYPQIPEAHWVVAQLAQLGGNYELALDEVEQARRLRPDWNMAVSLEAQLLQKKAPQQGLEILRRYLSDFPDASEIRLQYARMLLEQRQYESSRNEFQHLSKDNPENPELIFAIALISLQLNDLQGAEMQLNEALKKGKKEQGTVQYYLGQLSEAKEKKEEALAHYRQVKDGEYQFAAQLRIVYILNKSGNQKEALEHLQHVQPNSNQQRVQLLLIEAQFLNEAKQVEKAYQVLRQGLTKLPNHPDLLYEAAILADKAGEHDVFEQLMRKLIQIRPDHAHAYNALGYGLLERNERIPEAVKLVEKALQLAPNDPAIMDSVGWGYYRMGKLDESIDLLKRAFASNPDPEIASHLGEVLWMSGDKEQAKQIWQESLKANPGNAMLRAVTQKFIP
jgi:tetratricopeptide (TPR) repeat protein